MIFTKAKNNCEMASKNAIAILNVIKHMVGIGVGSGAYNFRMKTQQK